MQTGFSDTFIAAKLEKPLLSLYGTEWRECGYGLWGEGHQGRVHYSKLGGKCQHDLKGPKHEIFESEFFYTN
jgi:hypothetical protein